MQQPARFVNANCRTDGSPEQIRQMHDLFYGTFAENAKQQTARLEQAMQLCCTCPAVHDCRRWALENWRLLGDEHYKPHQNKGNVGTIIGGMTAQQRWEWRQSHGTTREQKPINHGTSAGYRLHLARNDKPCEDCRTAERERERNRRERDRQRKRAGRQYA